MKKLLFLLSILITTHCAGQSNSDISTVAFGSCSRQNDPNQMWSEICDSNPDIWIWLGDIIYADTHNMDTMKSMYAKQKSHPDYQRLLKQSQVIGIWDDHDYGVNDGGKKYSKKKESKEQLLEFLDVSNENDVYNHDGVYTSYTFGRDDRKIKVILLDTRYFRDTLDRSQTKGFRYDPNPTGDILGKQQWKWLQKELKKSDARINIIGSGIQFISSEHGYEKWSNFPKARQRMIDLLTKTKPLNPIIISGDRHIAEISKLDIPNVGPLYDFTSSGLTHTWSTVSNEPNRFRTGDLIAKKNYGLILIDWSQTNPVVTFQIKGHEGLYEELKFEVN